MEDWVDDLVDKVSCPRRALEIFPRIMEESKDLIDCMNPVNTYSIYRTGDSKRDLETRSNARESPIRRSWEAYLLTKKKVGGTRRQRFRIVRKKP